MPAVGGKHYAYTKKGKAAAKRVAKRTGQTVTSTRPKKQRAKIK